MDLGAKEIEGCWNEDLDQLKVRIFADGANKKDMLEVYRYPHVKGFTTNPSLMRKAGVADYEAFAKKILSVIPDRSISSEAFADDFAEMARRIAPWGKDVSGQDPDHNTSARVPFRLSASSRMTA